MSCQGFNLVLSFLSFDLYAVFDMGHMILFVPFQAVYV